MKKLMIMLMIMLSSISFSQIDYSYTTKTEKELRMEMLTLREDGWKILSLAMIGHAVSAIPVQVDGLTSRRTTSGFIIITTWSVHLDLWAFTKFSKSRKIKRMLNNRPKF